MGCFVRPAGLVLSSCHYHSPYHGGLRYAPPGHSYKHHFHGEGRKHGQGHRYHHHGGRGTY